MSGFLELAISGLMSGLVIGLAALALTLVFGVARFANAATGDFMTIGAYAAVFGFTATGSIVIGGLLGLFIGAVSGVISYFLVFRVLEGRPSVSALLASIGVGFIIRSVLGVIYGHGQQVFQLPLVRPWRYFDVRIQPNDLKIGATALLALLVVFLVLHATPIGRRMRAVADDPMLARVSGIAPRKVMFALWAMSGAVAALAGVLLGIRTVIWPEMGWEMLIPVFAAAVLGGIGHPVGAVLAGVILGVVQEIATPYVGFTYKLALAFIILLVVLLVRPKGLFGRVEGVR
ncbi:branched-chain amino acid ABC transporter permease [Azorhizobium oxalatiphilum]|uniref:Branched-chain amino acid ABC transporter permease n=1 Tax=Azorhizobium oxalatiphilum TaxID=980631 RepID=A0A917F772_9HYPH|nr:branched-chain amino acid ABC transporter permease [Azorhizobium oxalatiphilum]GGF54963.1 branched-chain amino acid ABC transporter permease [Azorhizobium oxalatiphilum]